jgi:predicted MFS family arabinose efflux permease
MTAAANRDAQALLPRRLAVQVFLSFAFAYFFSALVRGVAATLAPHFSAELGLNAGHLGLLAGAYFFGFAAMQLPMGGALDRFGSRRVLLALLAVAVLGCIAFALARSFVGLTAARALIGVGVSGCLMAPMTLFRRSFAASAQMRANSWMLMTGSLGMVASTLPVQWLLPSLGWRGLFWAVAGLLGLSIAVIAWRVPGDAAALPPRGEAAARYRDIFRHRTFLRFAPLGFFNYGGLIAVQSLWAGPWLVQVCGFSAMASARGLFVINLAMLLAYWGWGVLVPRLYAKGWNAHRLITLGAPVSVAALMAVVVLGPLAKPWLWALFCVASTIVALAQPAIGQAFAASVAGRALSAYNLIVFSGVFAAQWGIGLLIDLGLARGFSTLSAYRFAFALLTACCALSYVWFLRCNDTLALAKAEPPA